MELGASAVPAGILQLEACRLQLDAFFLQLSTLYSVLDGGKYGSFNVSRMIHF